MNIEANVTIRDDDGAEVFSFSFPDFEHVQDWDTWTAWLRKWVVPLLNRDTVDLRAGKFRALIRPKLSGNDQVQCSYAEDSE
jgi:hypothetical protein